MKTDASQGRSVIYTVGHSSHPLNEFIDLLKKHRIEMLVDIRSSPYSKYVPHFNGPNLEAGIESEGIRYLFMGKELGGQPDAAELYDADGHVVYSRIAESPAFARAISRIEDDARRFRLALVCSEGEPAECHRHLLVARVLASRGVTVQHILRDGCLQTYEELCEQVEGRYVQLTIFDEEREEEWKSTRSASPRRKQPSSSAS